MRTKPFQLLEQEKKYCIRQSFGVNGCTNTSINDALLVHHCWQQQQQFRFMCSKQDDVGHIDRKSELFDNSSDDVTSQEEVQMYKKGYQISGIGTRSHVVMETNTGHTLQTDVPKAMGGTDKAPQPVETLLAAWMGCTQATAIFVGRNMNPRIYIDKIEFENIEAFRDERGALGGEFPFGSDSPKPDIPARLEKVHGIVKIYAVERKKGVNTRLELSEEQLQILSEQSERRCPVANMMVLSGCKVDVKWINA